MDTAFHSSTHSTLEVIADATPLVDNHAHPFWLPTTDRDAETFAMPKLAQLLSESTPTSLTPPIDARATLSFCRSLRDLHALLVPPNPSSRRSSSSLSSPTTPDREDDNGDDGTDAHALDTPSAIELAVETQRVALGPWDLAQRCFSAAGIAAVLIDDGLHAPPGSRAVPVSDFATRLHVPVARRVLRLETEAENVLLSLIHANVGAMWRGRMPAVHGVPDKRARTTMKARAFREAVRAAINPPPVGVVAFKSAAAYRSGLAIRLDWSDEELEEALEEVSLRTDGEDVSKAPRLERRVLVDCVVREGLRAAREHAIPIQFHCGFGDVDLRLDEANPILLREVFTQFPDVAVVLLHGAWPFTREAAYLSSVYPRVYLDLGLAIPLLSVRGMLRVVEMALEMAPVTKLLYSSDAHSAPDVFYLAARWGRRAVATALAAAVASGDLEQAEAKAAVRKILAENAVRLYRLPVNL